MRILKIIFGLGCIATAVLVGFAVLAIFSSWGDSVGYAFLILYACGLVLAGWFISHHRKDPMISKHKKIIIASAGVVMVLLVAALLKFGGWERTVVGEYRLEQFKDFKTYYLHKQGQDDSLQIGRAHV